MSVVSLRQTVAVREASLPIYVHKLLEFWGKWMNGVHMPHLDYPAENTISKIKRFRDGAGQPGPMSNISTLSDSIGLAVDREVERLTPIDARLSAVLVFRYYDGISSKEGCKRLHTSENVYDDLLKMARCSLLLPLEPWKQFL